MGLSTGQVSGVEGMECAEGHFTCQECLVGVTKAALTADLGARRRRDGRVACPKFPRECGDSALEDGKLVKLLPDQVVQQYLASRVKLLEARKVPLACPA